MHRALLSVALAGMLAAPVTAALAADGPDMTIYHTDGNALFQSGHGAVNNGYAVIRESRRIGFDKGSQDIVIGNLPDFLEPEAVNLNFDSSRVKVLSQRLMLASGGNDALLGQVGKQVSVIGDNGQVLVKGELKRVDRDGSLVIGGDVFGPTVVQRYSAVKLISGEAGSGSRLQVRVHADASGHSDAVLSYPTHGLGWRAAYTGTLQPGGHCRMRLDAMASIANRSGRDWSGASIKLFAGQPNIESQSNIVRPMMAGAMADKRVVIPRQQSLDAYRTYTLPGRVDLPDNSVTLTPLYAPRTLDCERAWTYENGNAWTPPRPRTTSSINANTLKGSIRSVLRFRAPETLPAGHMRVLVSDRSGNLQFIGESSVADTSRHDAVELALGTAFDLHAQRERTSFQYDKTARRIDEAFRVTLTNAGDAARTISVIEHPDRWTQWSLTSSSVAPARKTTDTLEFHVAVPAHGSTTLDYALRYQWTAADQ
jgi:hypothetical protein